MGDAEPVRVRIMERCGDINKGCLMIVYSPLGIGHRHSGDMGSHCFH